MGLFDLFRRRESAQPDVSEWWRTANALATEPNGDGIAALRATVVADDVAPDLAEAQLEMLEGLEALVAFAQSAVPVLTTQHRVIGADPCHFMAPASLIDQVDAGGKIFVTSARVIFAAGTVLSWPWHVIARVRREDRDVLVDLKGRPAVRLRLNTYEDALLFAALVGRLTNRP
jgi:hypothetical protein